MAPAKSWFERLWSEERRRAERHTALPLAAYYWDGAAPAPRQVRDISPEGMFLLTEQRWYPNTMITMTLTRSDKPDTDPDRSIKIATRVVRSGTDGVGLAFVVPSSRSRNSDGPFAYVADRKDLTEFLARLESDTGHKILKYATLIAASLIAVASVAGIHEWAFLQVRNPATSLDGVTAGFTVS